MGATSSKNKSSRLRATNGHYPNEFYQLPNHQQFLLTSLHNELTSQSVNLSQQHKQHQQYQPPQQQQHAHRRPRSRFNASVPTPVVFVNEESAPHATPTLRGRQLGGAFTEGSRLGAAKIRGSKGFSGGEKISMVRGGSRSQLDCCSECMVLDCSCSSAISSGNELAFEDNFQYHLATGGYHVPEEARDVIEGEDYYDDEYELFLERTQQQQQQQQQRPSSVVAREFIDNKRRPTRGNRTRLKSDFQRQVSTNLVNNTQRLHRDPLRVKTITAANTTNMTSTTANHHNNNLNHKISPPSNNNGVACHKISSLERGLAMNDEERKNQGLLGLLPAAVQDQELQSKAVMNFLENCKDDLSKYVYLRHLKDFNEKLFYHTLTRNVEKCMPLVYTPTVGLACQKFSEIYMRPRGLYITAKDAGRVKQILANWPETDVRVIVVTDGERILGLGDLGANGMGISIGKLSLYTALAGIPPQNVLPITIDVGTNNEAFLKDPFYIGLRQNRVRGEKYEQLIEEFMKAVVDRWGRSCLIQFEDFANSTAFNLLNKYRDDYCTFNDDIQGTASVCLSGLITASKLCGKRLRDCSFLFYGAGEANLGTAQLLVMAMKEDGLGEVEAKRHIWLVDSKGLVVASRTDLSGHKKHFAQDGPAIKDLEEIIGHTKPTAIIGASAQGGAFTESICKKMAQYNEKPIIFALSNPTSKAECTAEQAYEWTNGKCVFASGSPFAPVEYNGKTYITGQGNNAYIFPGVGLAAIGAHTHLIPEETFLVAARALSDQVTSSDTSVGLVYPKLSKIREVTLSVATRVLEYFYTERLATYRPEPNDKLEFLKALQYNTDY